MRAGSKPADVRIVVESKAADGIDVADVHGAGRNDHALRPRSRRTDDRIEFAQVEALESTRIQRSEHAKEPARERNAIEIRHAHALGRHEIADRLRIVEGGIDRRFGPRTHEVREHTLGPATLIQVVVDQSDPHAAAA